VAATCVAAAADTIEDKYNNIDDNPPFWGTK
jgi:hypothetical protein